jgi:hypothetical protein
MNSARLRGHGITVALPGGWEGRIGLRDPGDPAPVEPRLTGVAPLRAAEARAGSTPMGRSGHAYPLVHLANFALPSDRGDFGSGAVDRMAAQHLLLVLFEFGPESVGTALFRSSGMPQPQPHEFGPNTLQRRIPGQLGYQRFFTHAGRAFCLYAVVGSARYATARAGDARAIMAGTEVDAR